MPAIRLWVKSANAVKSLDLEEYLRGVLPHEMYASWPSEALKAGAVAARTYAMRAITSPRHKAMGADLCDTDHCQAWSEAYDQRTDQAVHDTAGETRDCDGQYISRCGRADCPLCNGKGGYGGKRWDGRLCQWGARYCAEQGMTYRDILALYYGDAVSDYTNYPRPANDTGAGVHGGANAYHPLGDNDGLIPGILSEMRSMGLTWVKLLDFDGSSYHAVKLAREAGIMPVVRLYQQRPYPGGRLSAKHLAALPNLVAAGAYYFERDNEPNLWEEWREGSWPTAWTDTVFNALVGDWIADGQAIVTAGGYVAIPACSPGGNYDDIAFITSWCQALKRRGMPTWMNRVWIAVHNAGLNHPLDYPDDAVNQREHPGQTIHTHTYVDGTPTGASNCIRKWEAVHQRVKDILGKDLPVLCTEGGFWPGNAADKRYPALTEQTASEMQATALRAMATAPAYLFAQMPWLFFNRKGANLHEGFECDAWKRWPGYGNCPANAPEERPIIQYLKQNPCKPRSANVTQSEIEGVIGNAIQSAVLPLVPTNDFAIKAKAKGYTVIRSDEKYIKMPDGTVYCAQVWQDPKDASTQHIIAAKVEGTNWWTKSWWFTRAN